MELSWQTVKAILREVLEEEGNIYKYDLTSRFEHGTLVFKPQDPTLKPREIPVEAFFKKIVAVREKLRVLEQKINSHPKLSLEEKIELEAYITRSYGSLTSFNFLFQREDQRFTGMKDEEE